jgi:hypothetical protein
MDGDPGLPLFVKMEILDYLFAKVETLDEAVQEIEKLEKRCEKLQGDLQGTVTSFHFA